MATARRSAVAALTSPGDALSWVTALVFCLSAFMGWYSAEGPVATVSIIAWHTGTIGKLVFFLGLAILAFLFLRAAGIELPPAVHPGLVVTAVGAVGTILVLVRVIDIPDRFVGTGRGIGIWISLVAALLVVAAGFVKSNEEL